MTTLRILPKNNSGFMAAEFLFAFTMVIGVGLLIFALTFSLTTIEIAQYIVWSSARSFAVGNKTIFNSTAAGEQKYNNLTAAFPLLTGNGSDSPWFKMADVKDTAKFKVGDITDMMKKKDGAIDPKNTVAGSEARHPWIGVESSIDLVLFKGLQIPFLGKITTSPQEFEFPIRALLFRHPSYDECQGFFKAKFSEGIKLIPVENEGQPKQFKKWSDLSRVADQTGVYSPMEDNGC